MPALDPHDPSSSDPLLRPMQPKSDQLRRAIWLVAWNLLCRWTPTPLHRWRCFVLTLFGARLGPRNFVYPSARIWAPWLLETEDVVTIGRDASVYNVGGIRIGSHAIVSEGAFLCGATHDFHDVNFLILDDADQLTGQVKAHKLVLSLVSEIFRIQFTGSFAELNQQENGVTQAGLGKTRI